VRFVFDENTPASVARALRLLAEADGKGEPDPVEVLHATEVVPCGTHDVPLIQAIADDTHAKTVLITTDKAMRTRSHERAAFTETGCIGIILRTQWNHASLWDRARLSLIWWRAWVECAQKAAPGTLWQSPWSERPKALKPF
jgi:hypothetical protein